MKLRSRSSSRSTTNTTFIKSETMPTRIDEPHQASAVPSTRQGGSNSTPKKSHRTQTAGVQHNVTNKPSGKEEEDYQIDILETFIRSEMMQVDEPRQVSATASIVSPCKAIPKKNDRKPTADITQRNKVDDNPLDFLDMMADGAGDNTAAAQTSTALIFGAVTEMTANQGRDSAISTSLAFRHSPEMMVFPEPGFVSNQPMIDPNPIAVQPTPALLEFDCCNMDFFEKGSFDSSKDGDRGSSLRRRHSLDSSSPHDHANNYKRFKQSHSLPHEYGHLHAPLNSFGSNTSDLTPIPVVGMGVKTDEMVPIKPNPSPMPLDHSRKIGVVNNNTFQTPLRVFLNPASSNNAATRRYFKSALPYSDWKKTKILLPRQLFPDDDKKGRRLIVIRGPEKRFTETRLDDDGAKKQIMADAKKPTVNGHFAFLKCIHPALEGCTFLLPGLKMRLCPNQPLNIPGINIRVSTFGSFKLGHDCLPDDDGPTVSDRSIAKRRVDCAICAFGGTVKRQQVRSEPKTDRTSIFRTPNNADKSQNKKASPIKKSRKSKNRYYDNDRSLSWEVETNISFDKPDVAEKNDEQIQIRKLDKAPSTLSRASSMNSESSKRYKCKLCGQPKQNHVCPLRKAVLRSIGVMAYPSANAHAADEPGELAPPLCEMNNFILLGSQSFDISHSFSFDATSTVKISQNALTSAFERRGIMIDNGKAAARKVNKAMLCKYRLNAPNVAPDQPPTIENKSTEAKEPDLLFQPTMEITQEQYRVTRNTVSTTSKRAPYSYAPIPMSYSQRESMSDKLFQLSKNIPGLAKECKTVLNETRANGGDWDTAVAELMTQVVIVVCCYPNNDFRLDGLSSYLLQLGISC